jgi:hypothetical protein
VLKTHQGGISTFFFKFLFSFIFFSPPLIFLWRKPWLENLYLTCTWSSICTFSMANEHKSVRAMTFQWWWNVQLTLV